MACSKYEYVKKFENDPVLLPNTWLVARVDGKGFSKFAVDNSFAKPNDDAALFVMTAAAAHVMREFGDITIAYGQSDEYSFVFRRNCNLYGRRLQKINSIIASLFAAAYVKYWQPIMHLAERQNAPMQGLPSFDCRIVCYPAIENVRDYISWRQVDCHINNMFNYCFHNIVATGVPTDDAYKRLSVTNSAQKQEILFSDFGINYNNLPELHRKGSVIIRPLIKNDQIPSFDLSPQQCRDALNAFKSDAGVKLFGFLVSHEDLIQDKCWNQHPHLLGQS